MDTEREMVIERIEEGMMCKDEEMEIERIEVETVRNQTEESEEMITGKEVTTERVPEMMAVVEEKTEVRIEGMTGGVGAMREIETGMSARRGKEVHETSNNCVLIQI
jgi:hypothetical protein